MAASKVYVGNLDFKVAEEELEKVMNEAGRVVSVDMAKGRQGYSKGFALVEYENAKDAERAIRLLNDRQLGSRPIFVREDRGSERPPREEREERRSAPAAASTGRRGGNNNREESVVLPTLPIFSLFAFVLMIVVVSFMSEISRGVPLGRMSRIFSVMLVRSFVLTSLRIVMAVLVASLLSSSRRLLLPLMPSSVSMIPSSRVDVSSFVRTTTPLAMLLLLAIAAPPTTTTRILVPSQYLLTFLFRSNNQQ
jgi:hypothetical protein